MIPRRSASRGYAVWAALVLIVAAVVAHYVVPESWLTAAITAVIATLIIGLFVPWASKRRLGTRPSGPIA